MDADSAFAHHRKLQAFAVDRAMATLIASTGAADSGGHPAIDHRRPRIDTEAAATMA